MPDAYDACNLMPFALRKVLADRGASVPSGPASCLTCRLIYTGRHVACGELPTHGRKPAAPRRLELVGGAGR